MLATECHQISQVDVTVLGCSFVLAIMCYRGEAIISFEENSFNSITFKSLLHGGALRHDSQWRHIRSHCVCNLTGNMSTVQSLPSSIAITVYRWYLLFFTTWFHLFNATHGPPYACGCRSFSCCSVEVAGAQMPLTRRLRFRAIFVHAVALACRQARIVFCYILDALAKGKVLWDIPSKDHAACSRVVETRFGFPE